MPLRYTEPLTRVQSAPCVSVIDVSGGIAEPFADAREPVVGFDEPDVAPFDVFVVVPLAAVAEVVPDVVPVVVTEDVPDVVLLVAALALDALPSPPEPPPPPPHAVST